MMTSELQKGDQPHSLSRQQPESTIVIAAAVSHNSHALHDTISTELPETNCLVCENQETLYEAIEEEIALVILTEEFLSQSSVVEGLHNCLKKQPNWSDIPVIILLKSCETFPTCLFFLHQVEFSSSMILLEMPIKAEIFLSVVKSSLRNRQRQYALRDALERLQGSNQILEDFAHTAAHELRNPLGVISGSLQFLQARNPAPERRQQLLAMATRTAKEMNQTLTALLNYGKLQADDSQDFTSVNMQQVVIQAQEGIYDIIQEHHAEIIVQDLPTVWGKEQLLVQLVRNFIKNAIVHNPSEVPQVKISVQAFGEKWRFFVQDNGTGISPEDQKKIFTMFEQGSNKKGRGSGIGLAFCRRVVEKHQGKIGVKSELGQGSTFYFDLLKADDSS